MQFASDNTAGVAPEIMEALRAANAGSATAYGADGITARLKDQVAAIFEHEVEIFPVATGSAANSIALATGSRPWSQIFCHAAAHCEVDEAGAPEFFTNGAKLTPIAAPHGLITPAGLQEALAQAGARGVHQCQPDCLSITQLSEYGAAYQVDEIAALAEIAHARGMRVHMDGARFANALATRNISPAEMSWKAGVDVLSLGATKGGAMAAEMLVVFSRHDAAEMGFRRKRGGHLFSKMRFLSAQLEAWLRDDLWIRLARQANDQARKLAQILEQAGCTVLAPVDGNMVFARLPGVKHHALRAAGAEYYPDPPAQNPEAIPDTGTIDIRLVCSFETGMEALREFERVLRSV